MNVIIILCIFLLYIYINRNKKESYSNYKSVVVTPQSAVYKGIRINSWIKDSLYWYIAKNLASIYPIQYVGITAGSYENIINIENHPNDLALVQNDTLQDYIINENPNTNIRYITCIGLEQITVILPIKSKIVSWQDVFNKKIGTYDTNSGSYKTLVKLIHMLGKTNTILASSEFKIENIMSDFANNKIDMFFAILSNPDINLINLAKKYPIRIMGTEGIDNNILQIVLPYYTPNVVDVSIYKNIVSNSTSVLQNTKTIKTHQTKIDLVCHKDFDPIECYLFIKTIFANLSYINNNGNDIYKLQMIDYNPSYLYIVNNIVQLHPGVRKFLQDINIISNNPSQDCAYKVGIEKCTIKNINKYRLL